MGDQPSDDGKGKIVIPWKWRDEEGELDLSDPNDLEKAKRLINQGYGYEKGQQELKTVKGELVDYQKQLQYWDSLVEDAKETGDSSKVLAALEMVGVKVNKAQKDDDDFLVDEGSKRLEEVQKKVDQLEQALYNKYTTDQHSQLEAKYNDGKYPEYKRKEVEDFANKKGIRDFEDAYFIMNKDDILKMEKSTELDKHKKHADKIRAAASKEPGTSNLPPKPPPKFERYSDVTKDWTSDPSITENLWVDE